MNTEFDKIKIFILLVFIESFIITFISFNQVNLLLILIVLGISISLSYLMIYLIKNNGFEFKLEKKLSFNLDDQKELKLNGIFFGLISIFIARVVMTYILVLINLEPLLILLLVSILDLIDSQLIVLMARNRFYLIADDITDLVSRVIVIYEFFHVYYVPIIISSELFLIFVKNIKIELGWLKAFVPDLLFMFPFINFPLGLYCILILAFNYNLLLHCFNITDYERSKKMEK